MLEGLPADTPPVVPRDESEGAKVFEPRKENWIWILVQNTSNQQRGRRCGGIPSMDSNSIMAITVSLFHGSFGLCSSKLGDTVRWWMPMARSYNEITRATRFGNPSFTS